MIMSSAARVEVDWETPWTVHLQAAEAALASRNLRAAVRAWDEAHLAAVGSLRWEGLIEVGDAYLRIGRASGARDTTLATARRVYFAALYRATRKDSLEGILRAGEAFAALGDRQVVDECVCLAELLAADDTTGRERLAAFIQWLARWHTAGTPPGEAPAG